MKGVKTEVERGPAVGFKVWFMQVKKTKQADEINTLNKYTHIWNTFYKFTSAQ